MEVAQLRGKLEARDTEKKRLEATNAELQDSLLLRAQQGERDLQELETRCSTTGSGPSLGLSVPFTKGTASLPEGVGGAQ